MPDALYRLRTDVIAASTYSTNWWLIASNQSYFEALGRPPLLRHLWSLAVEEQWYLLWPLVFVVAVGLVRGRVESVWWCRMLLATLRADRVDGRRVRPGRRCVPCLLRHGHPHLRSADQGRGGDGVDAVAVAAGWPLAPARPRRPAGRRSCCSCS